MKKVLIVDENRADREAMKSFFNAQGHSVVEAIKPEFEKFEEYDLVLLNRRGGINTEALDASGVGTYNVVITTAHDSDTFLSEKENQILTDEQIPLVIKNIARPYFWGRLTLMSNQVISFGSLI